MTCYFLTSGRIFEASPRAACGMVGCGVTRTRRKRGRTSIKSRSQYPRSLHQKVSTIISACKTPHISCKASHTDCCCASCNTCPMLLGSPWLDPPFTNPFNLSLNLFCHERDPGDHWSRLTCSKDPTRWRPLPRRCFEVIQKDGSKEQALRST
jgi:hypothetical protein